MEPIETKPACPLAADSPASGRGWVGLHGHPGFRFWWTDAVTLGIAAALTWALRPVIAEWSLLIPLVVGHFFLFCNVFRVGTRRELAWTAVFLVNAFVWLIHLGSGPTTLALAQAPVTLVVIGLAVRDPDYHGLGSTWLGKGSTVASPPRDAPRVAGQEERTGK